MKDVNIQPIRVIEVCRKAWELIKKYPLQLFGLEALFILLPSICSLYLTNLFSVEIADLGVKVGIIFGICLLTILCLWGALIWSVYVFGITTKKEFYVRDAMKESGNIFWAYFTTLVLMMFLLTLMLLGGAVIGGIISGVMAAFMNEPGNTMSLYAYVIIFVLALIPVLIYGVYWIFAEYMVIAYGVKRMQALRQSMKIVRGRWWNILCYIMLPSVFSLLIGLLLKQVFGVNALISDILTSVIDLPVSVFFGCVFMLLFLNLSEKIELSADTVNSPNKEER